MLDKLNNNDLVITNNQIKEEILEELNKEKKLLNLKFMTLKEFKQKYFGTYDDRSIYYLMKKHKMNYGVAKEYLDNIYIKSNEVINYYQELKQNNLLIEDKLFKQTLKNIKVIDINSLDEYIKEELNKYNTAYITLEKNKYTHKVYEFDTQTNEIIFIAESISKNIQNINKTYLVNPSDEYINEIKNIFNLFNIPINITKTKKIYSTKQVKTFLNNLYKTKDIEKSLNELKEGPIKNTIIDTLNDLNIDTIDEITYEIIKNKLKEKQIKINTLDNAVNIINLDEVKDDDNYYYLLDFIEGKYPQIYHDDDLIKDKEKQKLKINTSYQNLINNKNLIKEKIQTTKNIIITYKQKDYYNSYYPSNIIKELNLEVKNYTNELKYSNKLNKILYTKYLDDYISYNKKDKNLEKLYTTYEDNTYNSYDNKFTKVSFNNLQKYLNNKLNISYSSMNNYYNCAFKFYIENILKLDPFEDNFSIFIGHLFHYCLSKMYEKDFDLKKEYNNYANNYDLSAKEKFYVNKLYKDMEEIINKIKEEETHTTFKETKTEEKYNFKINSKLNITFIGFVDKIKEKGNLKLIVDYKTGTIKTSLDNINYGLNLQLPVYAYLIKKDNPNNKICGLYLQHILSDSTDLKLEGYTIDNEQIIKQIDDTYQKSEIIKGLSKTKEGFSKNSKLLKENQINKIVDITEEKIKEVVKNTEEGNFPINPKRINNELIGCKYCKFRDLCFRKEENIENLKNTNLKEIVGEENAKMD